VSEAGAKPPGRDDAAGPAGAPSEPSAPSQALAGWRVLVPRPAGRAGELAELLRAADAEPMLVPLIEIHPETGSPDLHKAVTDLAAGAYDWVAFTSAAAVSALLSVADRVGAESHARSADPASDGPDAEPRHASAGRDPLVGGGTRVAAVGPGTARELRHAGMRVDLMPTEGGSADLLAAAWPTEPPGRTVLLPRSDRAADTLPEALRAAGYRVTAVRAYRTVPLPVPASVGRELAAGRVDAVLLTSPSTATALAGTPLPDHLVVIAIGRPTADAAAQHGIAVAAIAHRPTATGLLDALIGVAAARVPAVGTPGTSHRK
jgi:uroporphyrinogen-III synthase